MTAPLLPPASPLAMLVVLASASAPVPQIDETPNAPASRFYYAPDARFGVDLPATVRPRRN